MTCSTLRAVPARLVAILWLAVAFPLASTAAFGQADPNQNDKAKQQQQQADPKADPKKDPEAKRYDRISHTDVLKRGLSIMDTAAIALARENNIPIIVYSIHEKGGFGAILRGDGHCTVVA